MSTEQKKQSIWIVAAGTGGHIFPGLSLAKSLGEKNSNFQFLFFGTRNRLEARLVPEAGYPLKFLRASQWKGRGILSRIQTLVDLVIGFFQVLSLYLKNQRPLCLIGVGGYVSVPVSLVAILFRVPFFIVEPNICAGISNKILSRFARLAFTIPGSDALSKFKCSVLDLGNPIREGFSPVKVNKEVKKILVLGGSQGAANLTEAVLKVAASLPFSKEKIKLKLQCGEKNYAQAQLLHKELGLGSEVELTAFISDVVHEITSADLIVSRAGAMSVAEISAAAVPCIFVPFPYAADDHQKKNAKLIADDGAAVMLCEGPQFVEELRKKVESLVFSAEGFELRRKLNQNFLKWGRPQATQDLRNKILEKLQ